MSSPTYLTLEQLGSYIKKLRKAKGLSQEDVAKKLGRGQPHISQQENVGRDFSLETVRKIIVVLGGTTIDRERIKVPIVKASDEEKAYVLSKNKNRREKERLPSLKTDDLDLSPKV